MTVYEVELKEVSSALEKWYHSNKRALPWRETKEPYNIWLSEVIMQQTRVEQGTPYYLKFIDKYPDVHMLADAPLDNVLKSWEGLGYYSRARNLHKAAKIVSKELEGRFPQDFNSLKKLPGVGNYIAAAIASICYDEPVPVVDGNVYRFLGRMCGVSTPINTTKAYQEISSLGRELMGDLEPGTMNQAMMEFGARHCTYKNPACNDCPFSSACVAHTEDMVSDLPVKKKSKPSVDRFLHFHVLLDNGKVAIEQRGEGDVWQGLYQFIAVEGSTLYSDPQVELKNSELLAVRDDRHVLSHQNIHARFFIMNVPGLDAQLHGVKLVPIDELDDFAMPRLMTRFIEQHGALINPESS